MALKGNFKKVDQAIKRFDAVTSGEVQAKVIKNIAAEFLDLVLEGFTESRDPYGNKWDELKYRDGQPLRDNGHLAGGFNPGNIKLTDNGFTIENPVPYGIHHQFGAPKAHIPARPMLPRAGEVPASWLEAADEAALEVVQFVMKK